MRIRFQTLIGKSHTMLDVEPNDSVLSVKQQIFEREGFAPEDQTLVFGGKQLDNNNLKLSEIGGLVDGSCLDVVFR